MSIFIENSEARRGLGLLPRRAVPRKGLTGTERLEFFREVLPLVQPENMPWKADDWANPTDWKPRKEPSGYGIWEK